MDCNTTPPNGRHRAKSGGLHSLETDRKSFLAHQEAKDRTPSILLSSHCSPTISERKVELDSLSFTIRECPGASNSHRHNLCGGLRTYWRAVVMPKDMMFQWQTVWVATHRIFTPLGSAFRHVECASGWGRWFQGAGDWEEGEGTNGESLPRNLQLAGTKFPLTSALAQPCGC
jgi:hypothetical protein